MTHHVGKLGKMPPKAVARTLRMSDYLEHLPLLPTSVGFTVRAKQPWGTLGNDSVGCCTCAALGHHVHTWTSMVNAETVVSTADVLAAYSAISGYDPSDPSTDRGAFMLDALNYARKTGIGGHKLDAYVGIAPGHSHHVRAALYMFGGVYVGVALPISAQSQEVWDVPPGGTVGNGRPGSWGGHAISIVGADRSGLTCITWGYVQRMTWAFWAAYADEAYAPLSREWLDSQGESVAGFDFTALQSALRLVT